MFLVLAHDRRRILHVGVTAQPTAAWTAQQLREPFPWETAPRYLLRDRDGIFGPAFVDQVTAFGMAEVLSTPGSPWQRARTTRVYAVGILAAIELKTALTWSPASVTAATAAIAMRATRSAYSRRS